jgi:molybdopterin-guanine dinucleotide biosynthesis protein B
MHDIPRIKIFTQRGNRPKLQLAWLFLDGHEPGARQTGDQGNTVELKLKSSQWIVDSNNRIIMAEGRMHLLEAIAATGSINRAAKAMGMSYKSAWSKIRSTEAHLQSKIVNSDKSRGTRLTAAGRELLEKYKLMKQQCVAADDAIFDTIFRGAATRRDPAGPERIPQRRIPIISFVGHSGSGKTTFIEKLLPLLVRAGVKTAIIKHDVHGFEMDKPGKDTWRHKKAGAAATIITSAQKIGLVMDADHDHLPHELAFMLDFVDMIVTEGFKHGPYPKIEVFRPDATGDATPLCLGDPELMAVISDRAVACDVPVFELDEFQSVADFMIERLGIA